ncbi:uncharacterized protein CEXT_257431 [Caerostris extrusa]|uniref:Uncharacterized protein n=1 Tax=Caerostris extrusa TaxID=172846 RepID=A0AAV4S7R8_CAEEX|nr:uncharacterized protein CEXT_257431 [Caerostris extrusa]
MNLNQATYAAPVCPDQAESIRIIQANANKALKNIQCLYEEIMTPKIYADVEASESDYSNDSPTVSFSHKKERDTSHQKQSTRRDSHYQEQSNFSGQEPNLQGRKDSYDFVHPIQKNSNLQKQNGTSHQQQFSDSDSHFQKKSDLPHQHQNTHQVKIKSGKQDQRNLHKEHSDVYQESSISYYQTPSILSNSESNDYENYFYKSIRKSDVQFRITIPRPFSLTAENVKRQEAKSNKISKLKEELNSQVEKELNIKFHPKPVPKHVHLPLYDKMVKLSEKRKKERKRKCTEIVNEKTKPFNLSTGTKNGMSKSKSISCLPQDEPRITFKS